MASSNGSQQPHSPKTLTDNFGAPVGDNQNSLTAGAGGPTLLADHHLIEKLAHFNRERVPERIVHAKGGGAFGYFEVTSDVSEYTCAAFLNGVGKRTEMLARFSTVAGEHGYADTDRDPRGFAVKFYTEEGNYDIVGNNTPIFFIRDAIKFPDFIHSQKRHPQSGLRDANRIWDFWSLSPESLHQVTYLMGDRGIPLGWQYMNGYGSHTFSWTNREGKTVWVKYHFKAELGVKNMTREEAQRLAGADPDFHRRGLFDLIDGGDVASWKLFVQIMPLEDAATYRFDPFDVTKTWSHKDYPLIEVGRMVLNRNPENYHADIEQAAFAPSTIVRGVGFSPDKMLQGRLFAYADAHRYRIGTNYAALPVNRPHATQAANYMRDGQMRFDANGGSADNYEPNSFGGPVQDKRYEEPSYTIMDSRTGRFEQKSDRNDDYVQAGDLYRLMKADEQDRLVDTIVAAMGGVRRDVQLRAVGNFGKCDAIFGERLARGLELTELLPPSAAVR
ncbi:MAG TPA: catalase [Candidatus Limnocylindria bacterium]|jgi:catalase|nr:catalase [Candidatus Limnocylindria bacterium]